MRKKMYKAGKVWVAATLAIVGVMTGGAVVSADDNGDELGVVADEPVPQPDQVVVLQKDETTSASSASESASLTYQPRRYHQLILRVWQVRDQMPQVVAFLSWLTVQLNR